MSWHEQQREVDHNPARPPRRPGQQIGVRALLSAGEHRPQVALTLPGVTQQVRLSAEEAADLAGRLLSMVHMARYDAAVYQALGQHPVAPDVHEAILVTLVAAREHLTNQGAGARAQATEDDEGGR